MVFLLLTASVSDRPQNEEHEGLEYTDACKAKTAMGWEIRGYLQPFKFINQSCQILREKNVYYYNMVDSNYCNDYKILGIRINMNKCYSNFLLSEGVTV